MPPRYEHKRTAYYGGGMLATECPSIVHIELVKLEKSGVVFLCYVISIKVLGMIVVICIYDNLVGNQRWLA